MTKTLNVIIDGWDFEMNLPKPNGFNSFDDSLIRNVKGIFDFYGIENIKYILTEDLIDDGKSNYFYFFSYVISLKNYFENNFFLNEKIIKKLQSIDKLYCVLLNEHECDNETVFLELLDVIKKIGLDEKKFILINSNELLTEYKIKNKSLLNVKTLKFLPIITARNIQRFKRKLGAFQTERNKLFLCHVRGQKPHRYCLLAKLVKSNMILDTDWSMVNNSNFHKRDKTQLKDFFLSLFTEQEYESLKNEIDYITNLQMKKSDFESSKNWFDSTDFFDWREIYELESYKQTYINITTESEFFDESVFITEKSIKPFFFFQVPVIFATQNHVKKMKQHYGFDFYEDLIDISYDSESNSKIRFDMAYNQISLLYNKRDDLVNYFKSNKKRFLKNQKLVLDIINDESDKNYFSDLKKFKIYD